MATPTSRTVPSSPNPSSQGSPRTRDRSKLKTSELGSAFRGISRGKGSRGGSTRRGRGGHPRANSGQKSGNQPDTASSTPSPSPKTPSISRKPPVPTPTNATANDVQGKVVNGSAERSGRPQSDFHKQSRATPVVVVAPASPSRTSQTAPPTPSRFANRRRRSQPGKGIATTSKPPPLPHATKTQKSRGGFTPASQIMIRKDVPPHLAAVHEAEVRHDVDVLVERVRAVAMAENRPTTPGGHIDWAGDEDDSLPDLDDWGVLTTHNHATPDEDQSKEISPILADTLKPLPEPNSEVYQQDRETETCDAQSERVEESPIQPSFLPSPMEGAIGPSSTDGVPGQCTIVPEGVEELSSPTYTDGKLPLHPSLPPKPVAAMESLRVQGSSIGKPSDLPSTPPPSVAEEEASAAKTEGLSGSIHALSADEHPALERVLSAPSSERGLAASIHAPVPGLPESHSAPSVLPTYTTSAVPRTHSRSQTEGRPVIQQPNIASPGTTSHRRGRSGVSSPLGRHACTHVRNQSTPAGTGGSRPPQASRPVITGEAISRLARTIGGHGPATRTQAIPVTKDSTVSSDLRLTS